VKVQALLGGKNPHPQTFAVGGMTVPIDPASPVALNDDALTEVARLLSTGLDFVRQAYLPDLLAIAAGYPEWATIGKGVGNFLSFGDLSGDPQPSGRPDGGGLLPGGLIRDFNLSTVEHVDPDRIAEYISHSWYTYDAGDAAGLAPYEGQTTPRYTGPKPPYEHLDTEGKYSWLKAPRYDGLAVEVGPLARVLIGYARGDDRFRTPVRQSLDKLQLGPDALFSTLGRTLARGLETQVLAEQSLVILDRLRANIAGGDLRIHDDRRWDPKTWPKRATGVGFHEAPRGGLSHWIVIENEKIKNYQAVVPTTWNASPRDAHGNPGPYEVALVGTPLADPARPLEMLRTLHSFDPCMACAAHVLDADGKPVVEVRVQ
jgi:Ni,Fe-hydrogenase I large subunit